MANQVSPGVNVQEIDLTTIIPAVSTTEAGIAGVFSWGPVEDTQLVSSEDSLTEQFGKPNDNNFETFFTASSFLAYGNKLYVSRAADGNAYNARAGNGTIANTQIKNEDHFTTVEGSLSSNAYYYAKYPGTYGNSLRISVCDSAAAFESTLDSGDANVTFSFTANVGSNTVTVVSTEAGGNATIANTALQAMFDEVNVGDYIEVGNTTIGTQLLKVSSIPTASANSTASTGSFTTENKFTLSADVSQATSKRFWEFHNIVDLAPGTSDYTESLGGAGDELHVVITDEDGTFTGAAGSILEVFPNLSRATDATGEQGGSIYYKKVLNNSSKYVWNANDRSGSVSNTAANMVALTTEPYSASFTGGTDSVSESSATNSILAPAWDKFKNAEDIDVSLLLMGKSVNGTHGEGNVNYVIDNIATSRKDLVVFASPDRADVVNNPFQEVEKIEEFRNALSSTSYAVLDTGYKLTYDRYNDVNRWVPLNGDVAGTCARTDNDRDPWWSPAGFNRGQIKNIIKLAFNPNKAERDSLYKNSINPVVSFKNEGTILYGDKTLLNKPSAFDRINVRRLFIVLEKAISEAAKYSLFEFNDEFTRTQFRNMIEPYLRDVQGRRGVTDFRVICDSTNNTGEVIDRNEFIGDIYIKPARSINFINLRFVAVKTDVRFESVIGSF